MVGMDAWYPWWHYLFLQHYKRHSLFTGRQSFRFLFTVLLVMIPELYPSSCRSFATGTGNLMSLLGGRIAPFIAQDCTMFMDWMLSQMLMESCFCLLELLSCLFHMRPQEDYSQTQSITFKTRWRGCRQTTT